MPKASDIAQEGRFMALFIGDSGSGKTPAAATFEKEGPVKIEDFDGRIRGLLGCPWIDRSRVEYDSYPVVGNNIATFFDRFNKYLDFLAAQTRMGQSSIKTHVLDSLTAEQWLLLKDAISLNNKSFKVGEMQMSSPGDYNFVSTGMRNVLTFYKSLPYINFICTAHTVDKYGPVDAENDYKGTKVVGTKLSLVDKLSAEIPGGFDHIIEFDRVLAGVEPKFFVRFWGDQARTVFPGMPKGWQDITGKSFYVEFMKWREEGAKKR